MAVIRRTMRELSDERHRAKVTEMDEAIADGRLIVRQMTPKERRDADAHREAGAEDRAKRAANSARRRRG